MTMKGIEMKQEHICKALIEMVKETAEEFNLEIVDKGTGHAFDNTFWKDLFKDESKIPNVIAKDDNFKIELRSFWGNPELSIRNKYSPYEPEDLMVLQYGDSAYRDRVVEDHMYAHEVEDYIKEGIITDVTVSDETFEWNEYLRKGNFNVVGKTYEFNIYLEESDDVVTVDDINSHIAYKLNDNSTEALEVKKYIVEHGSRKEYIHTGNLQVREVRVDGKDYKKLLQQLEDIIERVDERCKEFEKEALNNSELSNDFDIEME